MAYSSDDIEKQASPSGADVAVKYEEDMDKHSTATGNVQEYKALAKIERIAKYFGAEVRGIERVPEEEKTDPSLWTAASMWMGGNMVVATFALGALGIGTFGLNFWDSVCTIIFFSMLGAAPVAFFSTFGPEFGLRQMVLSRYWFGYQGVRIIAILNVIACIGWNSVNTMVSAQMLHTVGGGTLPSWAGVLILVFLTFLISFAGYRIIHLFEMFAWIPCFIIFIIVAVRMSKSGTFTSLPMNTGASEAGSVLSYGSAVYGFATGWTAFAADYTAYMRKDCNKPLIFLGVWGAVVFPCIFSMVLGAACMTGTLADDTFKSHYEEDSVGGLLYAVLVHDSLHGFGEFCVVVLALSTVANNIPNMYSLGLSCQAVWTKMQKVPRIVYTTIGCGISIAIAIPAYMYFAEFMHNFMNLIAYWLAIYTGVALSEHIIYRKGFRGYDAEEHSNHAYLPWGVAGIFGFCCGVAGAVLGMSQIWFMGPIAAKIGDPTHGGGDVGFPLGFAFAAIGFNAVRPFELKYLGK